MVKFVTALYTAYLESDASLFEINPVLKTSDDMVLAVDAGLPVSVALGMSMIVFAGSSQFIAAQLFASGTPGLVIVLTT